MPIVPQPPITGDNQQDSFNLRVADAINRGGVGIGTDGVSGVAGQDGQRGQQGDPGLNSVTVTLYQRTTNTTPPVDLPTEVSFAFATGVLTLVDSVNGTFNNWSTDINAGTGEVIWIIIRYASSADTFERILTAEWSAPTLFVAPGEDGLSTRSDVAYSSTLTTTIPGVNQIDNIAITGELDGEVVPFEEVQSTIVTGDVRGEILGVREVQTFDVQGTLNDSVVGIEEQQDMAVMGSLLGLIPGNREIQTFTPTGTRSNVRDLQGRTNEFLTLSLANSFNTGPLNVVDIQNINGSGSTANTFTPANNEFYHISLQSSFRSSTAGALAANQALFSFDPDTTNTHISGEIVNLPLGDNQTADASLSTIANAITALDSDITWDGTYTDLAAVDADFTFRLSDDAWFLPSWDIPSGRSWSCNISGPVADFNDRVYFSPQSSGPNLDVLTPQEIRLRIYDLWNAQTGYTANYVGTNGLTTVSGPAGAWGIRVTGPAYDPVNGSTFDDGSGTFIQGGFAWAITQGYRAFQTPDQSPFDFWGRNGQLPNPETIWTMTDNVTGQTFSRPAGNRRTFRSGSSRTQSFYGNGGLSGLETQRQITIDSGITADIVPATATIIPNTGTAAGYIGFSQTDGFVGESASTYTLTGPGAATTVLTASSGETLTSINTRINTAINGETQSPINYTSTIAGSSITATAASVGIAIPWNVVVNNAGGNGNITYATVRTQPGTNNIPTSYVFDPQTTASPTLYTGITPETNIGLNQGATAFLTSIGNAAAALETAITWDGVVRTVGSNREITIDLGTTTQVEATATITQNSGSNTALTSTRIDGSAGMLVGVDTIYTVRDHNNNVIATTSRTVPLATDNDLANVLLDLATGINANIEIPIDFMATSNGTQLVLTAQSSGVVTEWSVSVDHQGQVANVGNILFPTPSVGTSGTADIPGVGTTITITNPEGGTTNLVIAGRNAGYSPADVATLIAGLTVTGWDLSITPGSPSSVRFESDTGRVVDGVWEGTSTTNTLILPDATETRAGVDPVAVGVTSITVTTPDTNTQTVMIDGGTDGRSAIEISNALTTGLSGFIGWTASTDAGTPTVTMTADATGAHIGPVVVTSTNPDITFGNFAEPTPGVTFVPAAQATVTLRTPGNTFTQAYTVTGPKTNAQVLTELNQNLTAPGWSDAVDGNVLRFTNNDEIAVDGLFTLTSDLASLSFSTFVEEVTGAAQADAQAATFTFTQDGNTYTETLTGPSTAEEIAEVLATLSELTGYTASNSGANLIYTSDVVGLRTLIDAQVTGTDVTVTATIDTPGNNIPMTIDGTYLYPTGRFTDPDDLYMVAEPNATHMFRGERQVAWDVTEPMVSTDPDDYDFVRWVGEDGEDGDRTAELNLYFVNTDENTRPDGPIGQFVYNFINGTLLGGNLNGWTPEIPTLEAGNFLWRIRTTVVDSDDTILVEATEFSTASLIGSNGIAGGSGTNTAPVYGYKRNVMTGDTGPTITRSWIFSQGGFNNTDLGNGWTSLIPTGTDSLSFVAAVASNISDTDDVSPTDWSAPQLLGSSGEDGFSTAVIYAYKRASGLSLLATDLPSTGRTWTFADGEFDNGDLGNGWNAEIPFGTGNLFTSIAIASGTGTTDFVPATDWSAPQLLSQTGSDGAPGVNSAIVFLYQTSTDLNTAPAAIISNSIYTFASGTIAPTSVNGWTIEVPQVPQNSFLWITQAVASNIDGATSDTIAFSEWSTPRRVGTSGVDGTNGNSVAIVELYRVITTGTDLSTLATPTGEFTYTFATNTLVAVTTGINPGVFNGWAQAVPAISEGTSLLVIQAAAVSRTDEDTLEGTDFSSAVIISSAGGDGDDGPRGAGRWNYREGTTILGAYNDTQLNSRLLLAGAPAAAVEGDQLWIFGSPSPADLTVTAGQQVVYLYNGTTWLEQAEVIDGSLLVTNTVTARRVAAGNLTSTDVPTGTSSGAFFNAQGEAVIGNATNYMRFAAGSLTVSGEIQNLSRAALAAETGGPFFRVRPSGVATDVAAAIRTEFPTGSLAGEYVFVMVGSGGGGSAGTSSDLFAAATGAGGSAAGCCIFSFFWDGTTALSVTNGLAGGTVNPGNAQGTRIAGTNGAPSTFRYGGTLIAQANGGTGAPATGGSGVASTPGGTAVFSTQSDIDLIQTYARTGQSVNNANRGTGGAAVDFFGIITGVPGDSGHSPYNQGSFFITPQSDGSFDGAVGFIQDDNNRALMGFYGGSTALVSGFGSQQAGAIGGIAIDNSQNPGDDLPAGRGGILSGGGGTRNVATTRTDLSSSPTSTSSQAGNGGPGGGGGGAHCAFGRAVGGSGGAGSLWWSRL